MRTTFIDRQKEDSFTNDGYCVVELLKLTGLEEVQKVIREVGFGIDSKIRFRNSINQESVETKNQIFEKLFPVFQSEVDNFLQDYKILRIAIFDLLPGGSGIRAHQHANLVDESKFRSLTIWSPLIDTTVEMGTLHVIKGSHKIFNHVRSPNDYHAFDDVSKKVIKKYSTPLLLKAGQGVILDDRLIHWSPPNKSSRIRTAIQLELIPQEAELVICYRANDHELLKHATNEICYREAAPPINRPDKMQVIGRLNQSTVSYRNKQFISMMQTIHSDSPSQRGSIFKRLFVNK